MIPLLLPEDADYLARALTAEYAVQEIPYAALVGIAAVILNRVEDDRYPDSAAAVLSSWEGEPFSLMQNLPPDNLSLDACHTAARHTQQGIPQRRPRQRGAVRSVAA